LGRAAASFRCQKIDVSGGLPSRTDYLPQQPPRKKIMTRKAATTSITHSIKIVLSPDGGHPTLKVS
jgi:hypothetical protein